MPKKEYGMELILSRHKGRIRKDCRTADFLAAISDCRALLDSPSVRIFLDSRNRVGAVRLRRNGDDMDVVIKEFRIRGIDRIKGLFLPSKARKAWCGSWALVDRGIPTPYPLAYLENRGKKTPAQSFFITEEIKGVGEIRGLFRKLPETELCTLLESLAGLLRLCHEKGVLHRDLSDGNILVRKDDRGAFHFYFLDTNRVRLRERIGKLRGVKNLIRLGVPPQHQRAFLQQYFGDRNLPGLAAFWYRINKSAYTLFVGLKKKLKLRKIARKLRIQ
jgi:serine/threonine protein kinase